MDIASLGMKVESSSVAEAADNLERVTDAAGSAEKATSKSTGAFAKAGEEFEKFAKHARAHVLSLAGASEETRAFSGIIARLPLPLLGAAAALLVVNKAYETGAGEARAFAQALAQSGGAIGFTVGQLEDLAGQVGNVVGNTHKAAQAIAALVQSGQVGKENLQEFATVAVGVQEALGTSFQDISKQFAELAKDPLAASIQLNQQLGHLTPALYEQIRAYQQTGDAAGAAALAQKALVDSLKPQVEEIENYKSVWEKLGSAISNVWSGISNIGRGPGVSDTAKEVAETGSTLLDAVKNLFSAPPGVGQGFAFKQTLDQLDDLTIQKEKDADAAKAAAEANKQYTLSVDIANASIQAAMDLGKTAFSNTIQQLERTLSAETEASQRQEDILSAQRDANLITDQQYFAAKRKLIEEDATAQVAILQRENSRLQQEQQRNAALFAAQAGATTNPVDRIRIETQARQEELNSQNQIAANAARIAAIQADSASKVKVATIEEADAVKKVADAYQDAKDSAERYVDALQRRFQLERQGLGAGQAERDRAQQRAAIEDDFLQRRQTLDDDLRRGQITRDQYEQDLKVEEDALKRSEELFDTHYSELKEMQSDWLIGAQEAFLNYIDAARNVADLSDQAFSNAFKSLEDSVVQFVSTGKFSFKDLANSILAELVRIEIKILVSRVLGSIFGSLGGAGSLSGSSGVGSLSGSTLGFAAAGAYANAGQPFIVGEKGPELFVPSAAGNIVPNDRMGMGGGVTVNSVLNVGAGVDRAAFEAVLDHRDEQLKAQIFDEMRRGAWRAAMR